MEIIRNGIIYALTTEELYQAQEECIKNFMYDELCDTFELSDAEAMDVADMAYQIYSEGKDDLTQWQCIEDAFRKFNTRKSKQEDDL